MPPGALQIQTNNQMQPQALPPTAPNNGLPLLGTIPQDPQLAGPLPPNSQQSAISPTYYNDQQSTQQVTQPLNGPTDANCT